VAACICALAWNAAAQSAQTLVRPPDISFRNEVQHAIDQGVQWLQSNQNTNGWWSTADQPALTALALSALMGEPSGALRATPTPGVARGYKFITDHAKPDGGIYEKGLMNYNTSICMMGLMAARNPQYDGVLRKARQWLISRQVDLNGTGTKNSPLDCGGGYGDGGNHADMNNTMTALEALYYSKYLEPTGEKTPAGARDLNWAAAIRFVESCQNLPPFNTEPWVSTDSRDKGGFVYEPGESKADAVTNAAGRTALRSYGSMSCAGLLSYVYANVKPDDPRVLGVYDWLRNNFTADENPGMGQQGLYYYLHLMTKALTIYGIDQLPLMDGQSVDWRREVAMKLINLQNADGSWANEDGRWREHDPVVATFYAVMSLEILYRGL
jgi:squalene-hopene/tetraprenyl-beta-curcumene cyclase